MVSDNNNHPQATRCLNTGKIFPGRPTLGAWVSYALGTENENLPAFVVLRDPDGYTNGGTTLWENGWLPAVFRGTEFQSKGSAVLNLHPAVPAPMGVQENNLAALAQLNEERRKLYPQETELDSRIRNYELAARMQLRAEPVLDLSGESDGHAHLYGLDNPVCSNYGTRCLMARRMVEAGVRFVLVTAPVKSGGMPWDQHDNLKPGLEAICPQVDQPSAALIQDLKARGLLDPRWCCGPASSAACRSRNTAPVATTTVTLSARCWPAADSKRAISTGRPMSSAIARSKTS